MNQWVAQWWQLASGQFAPRRANSCTFGASSDTLNDICLAVESGKYEMISINDPEETSNSEAVMERIKGSFENKLGRKCSFER